MPAQDKTREQLLEEQKELRRELEELKLSFENDIAQRRLTEQRLKNSEERWKIIFDYAPDAFYLYDLKGKFIDGNLAAEKLLGYNKEELIGKSFLQLKLLEPHHLVTAAKLLVKNILGQSTGPDDLTIFRKDGSKVIAEISTHPVKVQDRTLVLGIARNITARINSEETLRESENKLQRKVLELSLLSSATFSFLESDTAEDIYNYLGEKLYRLSGADFMISTEYSQKNKCVSVKQLYGANAYLETIARTTGINLTQIQVPIKELADQLSISERRKIYRIEGGIFSLTAQKISKTICNTIERTLGIKEIHSIGLIWKDFYFGGVTFFLRKENQLINRELIESIVHQAALALSRKHAEESLLFSEANYRRFFNDDLAGNYKTLPDGTIMMCNPAFAKILGCASVEQAIGMNSNDFCINDTASNDNLVKLKEQGKLIHMESTLRSLDGRTIHVIENRVGKFDCEGELVEIDGYMFDITERKQAEEKIKEREAQYETLARISPVGIFRADAAGATTYVNPEWCRISGLKPELALNNGWLCAVHPDDLEKLADNWEKTIRDQSSSTAEYRFVHADGSIAWVIGHAVPEKNTDGKIVGYVGTISDITERKRAENALRVSEEKFRMIFNESPIGIELYNADGIQTDANKASLSMFGITDKAEVEGFNIFDGTSLDDQNKERLRQGEHVEYQAVFDFDRVTELQQYGTTKTGKLHFDYIITPLTNHEKNSTQGYLLQVKDVTEYKNAEKDLRIAKEKAEESDRLKSAFLANMSHEIRTPMNGILGFAELLKEPDLTGNEQEEYIQIIEKSGVRMLNIINDIVDISKIESGQMELSVHETNIHNLIKYIFTFFKPEAEAKGLQIIVKNLLQDNQVLIETDKEKVYAILINLVKNAIKYSDQGSIEIGLEVSDTPASSGTYQKTAKSIIFYVRDTGIGIPKDRQMAIFDRFVQADIADVRAYQGAGLGLSISKAYAEMLGGRIWVESDEGKGSVFYFTIPYCVKSQENKVSSKIVQLDMEENLTSNLKILIAEDDDGSAFLIKIALKTRSKEIIHVKNGIDAVKACRDNPDIDLILMDIKMPLMDGHEATRQIRQFNPNVVIIAQTAYALSGDDQKAIDSGCNDYISKPIKKDQLFELIQKYF